ncbi:exonuclease subunit SbcD [Frankia sp. AiPa1]|uniref:metallophosphoesterase family protein n=1 Tax=Frankia sp. AiPa1 TaxID=573492 RepID=UPI00202B02DE|nr:exonuclease subunit SbcD [Frankia sp. AiPa1]
MLALHTSDWHLGRALHGHDLLPAQVALVDHFVEVVRTERVDLVLVAGDVHDRAIPPVRALELFNDALSRLRDAGARVVVISGNHDAARRLGDKAGLLDPRISIRTSPTAVARPVVIADSHGSVRVYPIPYLEPTSAPALLPDTGDPDVGGPDVDQRTADRSVSTGEPNADGDLATGEQREDGGADRRTVRPAALMRRAMGAVRADLHGHPGARSVVLGHVWVTGGSTSDSERDISVGGLGNVPAGLFDGITYTALGHLHRPQAITHAIRYSGSPMAFSFSEASDRKASLLVELGPGGLGAVHAVPVPVERRLTVLRGALADLLASPAHSPYERDIVAAVVTDPVRPLDAMVTLQRRFPFAVRLTHEPPAADSDERSFAARTRGRTDLEIALAFVTHVRTAPSPGERGLLSEALDAARAAEDAA